MARPEKYGRSNEGGVYSHLGVSDFATTTSKYDLIYTKQQEENIMSTSRRVVTVMLMDDDKGLDVSDSLVCKFKNIVTEDSDNTVIQEVIMDNDIAAAINKHNNIRLQTVDVDILQRTGNEVKLRPVKLKNLRWVVSQA